MAPGRKAQRLGGRTTSQKTRDPTPSPRTPGGRTASCMGHAPAAGQTPILRTRRKGGPGSRKSRPDGGSGCPGRKCTCTRKEGTPPHPDADTMTGSGGSCSSASALHPPPAAAGGCDGGGGVEGAAGDACGDAGGAGSDGDHGERCCPRSLGRPPVGSSPSIARRCPGNP